MSFAPYATLPEFKAWVVLSDTIDDVVMSDVLESVTRWIDEYCDRHFWQEATRTFTPTDCHALDIDDLVSITSLKTDDTGDGVYETTWAASDYQLQPVNRPTGRPYRRVEAVAGRLFPYPYGYARSDRVEITGPWGWPTAPNPVHQACLIQASRVLKRRYSPEGVAGFGEFGAVQVSGRLDPDVMQLLGPYRRMGMVFA